MGRAQGNVYAAGATAIADRRTSVQDRRDDAFSALFGAGRSGVGARPIPPDDTAHISSPEAMRRLCQAASDGEVEEPLSALRYLQTLDELPEQQKELLDSLATGFANSVSATWQTPINRFEDELHWRKSGAPRLAGLWREMLRNNIAYYTTELPPPAELEGWLERQASLALIRAMCLPMPGLERCRRVLVRDTWQQLVRHSTVAARHRLDDKAYAPAWKTFWEGVLAPVAGQSALSVLDDTERIRAAFTEQVVGIANGTVLP